MLCVSSYQNKPSLRLSCVSSSTTAQLAEVNGQTLDSSGNDLLFTYSRPLTPIVLEVLPEVPWISQEVQLLGSWSVIKMD